MYVYNDPAFIRRVARHNRAREAARRRSLLEPKAADVPSDHATFTLFAHADPREAERVQKRLEAMGAEVIREVR
jgi:hypothetical protein